MNKAQPTRKNAQKTRTAILDAAELVFAQHGFDGARIDHIAEVSCYNKTLIFRYFVDKLNLYKEVLKRIDQQWSESLAQGVGLLVENECVVADAVQFRTFLKKALGELFDFMANHQNVMRMLIWEHAEGWQTYVKLPSLFEIKGFEQIEEIFARAGAAGVLRSEFDPMILFVLAEQICWIYPTSLPYYQLALPSKNLADPDRTARYREQIIDFIIGGLIHDPQASNQDARSIQVLESK